MKEKDLLPERQNEQKAGLCGGCLKPQAQCVCSFLVPQPTQIRVLFLQHPQEPRQVLSTAYLAHRVLSHSLFRIGLSWPSLKAAAGEDLSSSRWGVFYVGGRLSADLNAMRTTGISSQLVALSKKGRPLAQCPPLEGVVLLDGTWSQAKTLWWRNPWLLKLQRLLLLPKQASLYGAKRKEPRRECLSTLETLAEGLPLLGESASVQEALLRPLRALLGK